MAVGVTFVHKTGDGFDTIEGFKADSTLKIDGSYSTTKSDNDIIVTVGNDKITLVGAASLSTVNIIDSENNCGWTIDGNQASYSTGDEVLFTIYGISSTAKVTDFNISGTTVTISKGALGTEDVFLEGEGYTLALASDVSKLPNGLIGGWSSLVNGKATYTASIDGSYYTLEDNTVTYTPPSGGEQFTFNGITSTLSSAIEIDEENFNVILHKSALGTANVTFESDTFSLELGDDVPTVSGDDEPQFTSYANGTATYKTFGSSAYYTLEDNEVSYTAATADKQFTLSGLADGLTLEDGELEGVSAVFDDDSITFVLSEVALKNSNVSLSGTGGTGGTLALDDDVPTSPISYSGWSEVVNGTASYGTGGKSKYYKLVNGKVVYYAETTGSTQLTVTGLSDKAISVDGSIDGLDVDSKSLTVSAAAIGKNFAVTLNKKKLAINLADDVKNISFTGTSDADNINVEGTNVSVNGGKGNDTIKGGSFLTGGAGNDVFIYDGGNTTITDYTASADKISLTSAQIGDYNLNGKNVILSFGAGDSLTLLNAKDKKVTFAQGKTTTQYIFTDAAMFNSGKTTATLIPSTTNFNASVASALVTIDATKTKSAAQIIGNAKANKIYAGAYGSTINGGAGNDSITGGAGADSLLGGAGADKLYGGDGKDTLIGGTGTLNGGKGADIFVYSTGTGNDVIADYASGTDKISLGAGASVTGFSVNKTGDLVLNVGKNTLTLKKNSGENIATNGKAITFIDASGNESTATYFADRVITTNGVTLNSAFKDKTFTAGTGIVTVDATATTKAFTLNGNALNNVLTGGNGADTIKGGNGADKLYGGAGNDKLYGDAGNDTLWGGTGTDSLWGGAGADTFVYAKGDGKDYIYGFGNDDLLQITGLSGKVVGTFNKTNDQLTLKVGSTTVAVFKEFTASTFNVNLNGTNYQITK